MGKKAKKSKGQPPKFVCDMKGKGIYGLSGQPVTKNGKARRRYYATFSSPRKWFGFLLYDAMNRYAKWLAEQGKAPPSGTYSFGNVTVEFKTSKTELKEADQPLSGNRRRPYSYLRMRHIRRIRRPAKPPAPPDKQGKLFECD